MTSFDIENVGQLRSPVPRPRWGPSPCSACPVRHLTVCAVLDPGELHDLTAIVSNVELSPGQREHLETLGYAGVDGEEPSADDQDVAPSPTGD